MVEVEIAPPAPAPVSLRRHRWRVDVPALCTWTVAFTLVTYLGLRGGGYDIVVRSDAAVMAWWIILLGALARILPTRISAPGWIAIGLMGAFAVWTGLAIGWSQSAEQSVIEVGRVASYLGVLVLAIALQGRAAARHTMAGLTCAIGLVTVLAVLSRLHPQAFPPNQNFKFLGPTSARKLSYPLNYWNALADFAAMGVPLLLAAAVGARRIAARALAAATLPLSAVCVYLTVSRGGVLAVGVGIAVFLLLIPRRLEALATLLVSGVVAAILLRATAARPALTSGVPTHAAIAQGAQLLALSVLACLVVAALQVGIARVARHPRPAVLTPGRHATAKRAIAAGAVALVIAGVAGVPSKLAHAWHDFRQPSGVVVPHSDNTVFSRLQAANGDGRYQFWQSAFHAAETRPWTGIGPGTFQFWWTEHATTPGFIRNAHSLYFETLAETGIVGFTLLGGLLLWFVVTAIRRSLREPPATRLWLAAAAAGLAVFLFAAAVEWVWQLAAIGAAALIMGAVIVAGHENPPADTRAARLPRVALAVLAVAALGAVLVPLAGRLAVRDSQAAAAEGHLGAALQDSLAAQSLQPYAASAHLQEALVLEAAGDLRPAAAAAAVATTDSPTDWTTWLTLARIDARRGATGAALAALRRARELNPLSSLFVQSRAASSTGVPDASGGYPMATGK
jgi:hypothetical protein